MLIALPCAIASLEHLCYPVGEQAGAEGRGPSPVTKRSRASYAPYRAMRRMPREGAARMLNSNEQLARGYVTTWAGVTRVWTSECGVREVKLPNWRHGTPGDAATEPRIVIELERGTVADAHLAQALRELAEFYESERREFTVALDPEGAPFYQEIWAEVARVPYGETRSYGEIARAVATLEASRAVGAANGANPVAPFVPCHRIVGSDGKLTGYGPGLPLKQRLLVMEDAVPASTADYHAWTRRLAARYSDDTLLGVRGAGVYCRLDCPKERPQRLLPGRIFHSGDEARAAGFAPCPVCQPDRERATMRQESLFV